MPAEPEALDGRRAQAELALLLVQLGATGHVHGLALLERKLEPVVDPSRDRDLSVAPVVGSFSVRKTFAQASLRRSSVTSPSTQTAGSRPRKHRRRRD